MSLRLSRALRTKRPKKRLPIHPSSEVHPPSVIAEIDTCISFSADMETASYHRPSMIGTCKRKAGYFYLRTPVTSAIVDTRFRRILDNGSKAHEAIQEWYLSKSLNFYIAHEVHVWIPELEIYGHADSVFLPRAFDHEPYLAEYKTINSNGYKRLAKSKPAHVIQANLYMGLLGLKFAYIVYWNKDTQHLKEYLIEFDEEKFEQAKKWCRSVRKILDAGQLPKYRKSTCEEKMCRYVPQCRRER